MVGISQTFLFFELLLAGVKWVLREILCGIVDKQEEVI